MDGTQGFLLGAAAAAAATAITHVNNPIGSSGEEGKTKPTLTERIKSTLSSSRLSRLSLSNSNSNLDGDRPSRPAKKHVGIHGISVYTPATYISQSELEAHNGVSSGKYTLGLGQNNMAITGDNEDINSIALTAVKSLLEKYGISPSEVGRLEVGTETLVDKSKSTKTVLMSLFEGNSDIEGATVLNACYGGTSALLNAFNWCESEGWDGRFAIVVAADIAAYARGPARPTCGVGACAILIGRDAPLSYNPKTKATHAANVWDFFKPDHTVEYPVVDGALSQVCYYKALEDCYNRLCEKIDNVGDDDDQIGSMRPFDAETADFLCFHAPYNKLVQKSYARLYLVDARRRYERTGVVDVRDNDLQDWITCPIEETYSSRELDNLLKTKSSGSFKQRLTSANAFSKEIGNTYTASVFMGLASLLSKEGQEKGRLTDGKEIVMFSYGSGAMATMYKLTCRKPTNQQRFSICGISRCLNLDQVLVDREKVHPSELDFALETRAKMHNTKAPYSPLYPSGRLFPGTYYLTNIDNKWNRSYSRVPPNSKRVGIGSQLAPPLVLRQIKEDSVSTPTRGKLSVLAGETTSARMACVISGVAAGLPGRTKVFAENNLQMLCKGTNLIDPISGTGKSALLEKNVMQLKKNAGGNNEKLYVRSESQHIKLAAQLGSFSLTEQYGVAKGLAETMDVAAQVAVAAGLEALKDAGLVKGGSANPKDWVLKECHKDTTGVIYASSFPAMDAAVREVMRFLQSKTVGAAAMETLIESLRNRLLRASVNRTLSAEDEASLARLLARARETEEGIVVGESVYEFDRKFLFRVLVLGNAQLAQLAGCRGPNTQTNAACSGTTQAIGMAQDMLISGRAKRVVVVAGDNASGETLLPWIGSGFRALGAACIGEKVENAALPFDARRSGMLLGAGGIGMVLETEPSAVERIRGLGVGDKGDNFNIKARLLASQYSNSAYHGAALDRNHIGKELARFLNDIELIHGISKAEIATHGVYFSHETCTHASPESSCSGNEVAALREAFGEKLLQKLLICNTKGFTGHPMGVSFEDVTAVEVLVRQEVPPISNWKEKDANLGKLNLSKGGKYSCRYALRFAAGFGSQVAFALYSNYDREKI